jgi:hypothetical protein
MIGGKEAIIQTFKSGKLLAAVVSRPEAEVAKNDGKVEFGRKFYLVTAENVEGLLEDHPGIFGLR